MIQKGKRIAVYPEYHLSDFPPKSVFSYTEACKALKKLAGQYFDILVAGYVENENGNYYYSSVLIIDEENTYNLRKKYPYKDEADIIVSGNREFEMLPLSIGNSYFFICNDVTHEITSEELKDYLIKNNVEYLFLISAMAKNFEKWLNKVQVLAKKIKIKTVIYSDRFHGQGILKV